ncbi:MAG: 1-acyl-sn-glycerol-3-phosphate acyltransferase [Chloroflexi bacterium]|nr:1-acyl-sn-glycerol-3-phosphate acyltransferase [Chloroflexota bacterium]
MKRLYQIPLQNQLCRKLLTPIFRGLFHLLGKVEIEGAQNIPTRGAYVVVFNHVSIFDPPLIVAFWPTQPEILGAVDIWNRPGQSTLARLYGAIPIHRGEVDRTAMGRVLAALRIGRPLLVAPEGTRSHTPGMNPAKSGIVYVLERTGVPIVPVGVVGTTDDFFERAIHAEKPRLSMRIGESFFLPPVDETNLSPKEIRQRKADWIMCKMAALLPENYRGVYGRGRRSACAGTV